MKLVLIGAPAAGKGTQSRRLVDYYSLGYLSTGDILREYAKEDTEIGHKVKEVMAAGKLVADELIIDIVKDRIQKDDCKNGFILDGFPRNKVQAEMLEKLVGDIDKAIYINVPDDEMLVRMTGRRTCPQCGATYHIKTMPPKTADVCDVCGSALIQRKDDNVETGKARLKTFHDTAEPLIDYYRNKNLLLEVDGLGGIDEITKTIIKELGERA